MEKQPGHTNHNRVSPVPPSLAAQPIMHTHPKPRKISTIKDNAWYDNGAQIACSKKYSQEGYICAFLQNTKGYDGKRIKPLADHLNNRQDDKCNNCGSVPTEPGNDVSKGQLTFNFVDEDKLQDRCPYFERAINSVQLCKASNE